MCIEYYRVLSLNGQYNVTMMMMMTLTSPGLGILGVFLFSFSVCSQPGGGMWDVSPFAGTLLWDAFLAPYFWPFWAACLASMYRSARRM